MFSVIYNELVFNLLKERFGEGEAVVFARASAAGGQRSVSSSSLSDYVYEILMQLPGSLGWRLRVNV